MLLYRLTNRINGKIYFGITVKTLQNRWVRHKSSMNTGSNCPIHRAMRKYGHECFDVEEIASFDTIAEMKSAEIHHIALYDSTNPDKGYNITRGGDGTMGVTHSPETRALIRQGVARARKEGKMFTEQWYHNMRLARQRQVGIPLTQEHRNNISASLVGRHKNHKSGKQPVPVDQFTKDGQFIQTFDSYGDTTRFVGSNASDVMRCCQGKRKSIKGFIFKFHEAHE